MGCGHGILANRDDFEREDDTRASSPSPRSRPGSLPTSAKRSFSPARLLDSMHWTSNSQNRTLKIGPSGNNHQWAGVWNVPVALFGSASDECCRAIAAHLKPHLIQKDEVYHFHTAVAFLKYIKLCCTVVSCPCPHPSPSA